MPAPRLPQIGLWYPFVEEAVEPLPHLREPILDSPPHSTSGRGVLALGLEVVIVAREGLEQLTAREPLQVSEPVRPLRHRPGL
jgi:hypothetical protein